jgi:NitT/TauT family transport system permease protein
MSERTLKIVLPVVTILAAFVLWELLALLFKIDEFILPRPSVILASLVKWQEAIWPNAVQTLYTTLIGFGLAVVTGLALGLAVGYFPLVYSALYPLLVGFNAIPKAALVPVFILWLGIGTMPAILTAYLISFFPIMVNVATGLATLEPELQDVLRSLGASRLEIFWKVGFPRSLPYFFASLKVAAPLAFVGAIIAELAASNRGIGNLMTNASARFDVPLVFAGLMVVAAMGIALYAVFALLERRFTRWAYR